MTINSECTFEIVIDADPEIIIQGEQGPAGPPGTTNPQQFVVSYAASIQIDWTDGDIAFLTLTGNPTVSMIGPRKKCMLVVAQDAIGGRQIDWDPATISFGSDIPNMALSGQPNKVDYIGFAKNPVTGKFDVVAYSRGY